MITINIYNACVEKRSFDITKLVADIKKKYDFMDMVKEANVEPKKDVTSKSVETESNDVVENNALSNIIKFMFGLALGSFLLFLIIKLIKSKQRKSK